MAHEIDDVLYCSECGKHFRSQNPAVKNGLVVCWNCSDFTIMGNPKNNDTSMK